VEGLDGRRGLRIDIAGPPDLPLAMPKSVLEVSIPDGVFGHRAAIGALRALARAGSYHVVHAHGLRAGADACLAWRGASVPVFVTLHNIVQPEVAGRWRALLYRAAEPLVVRLSTRTFAISEDIARRLYRTPRDAHKVEVLHLGIGGAPSVTRPAAEVRAALGVADGQGLIVTASRLAPQKALSVMLEAMAELPDDVALAVLGQGPMEGELRTRAGDLGVAGRVIWLGWRHDVADHIAAADVFCLSSLWEGVPLAAMEAIMLGTPVVATDAGGTSELVRDGVSGRLVPPGDPSALAAALAEVLASDDLRSRYRRRARELLHESFSTERMLERLEDAYRAGTDA
jgi:glycosyltransferase involved in cell wall biosynthesis